MAAPGPDAVIDRTGGARPRRDVLRGAALVGAGSATAALLAACGGGPTPAGTDGEGSGGEGTGGQTGSDAGSVPVGDVPVGGGVILQEQLTVVTQPTEGDFHAFSAICTHQGCTVTQVDETGIRCPCHGSVFDATTGAPTQGPAPSGLGVRTVTVEGDTVSFA